MDLEFKKVLESINQKRSIKYSEVLDHSYSISDFCVSQSQFHHCLDIFTLSNSFIQWDEVSFAKP